MNPKNLKIEAMHKTPVGGQQVGVTSTGVQVTHIPTGLAASCDYHRSQLKNREAAMGMLEWGLVELGVTDK